MNTSRSFERTNTQLTIISSDENYFLGIFYSSEVFIAGDRCLKMFKALRIKSRKIAQPKVSSSPMLKCIPNAP
jgi:hypothetical protein